MNFAEQIKGFTANQAAKMIVEMLYRISDERLVQMTYLGEKLTNDCEVLDGIRTVRGFLQDSSHPTIHLFRKVLNYLPPENRQKTFNTLFNHAWFLGGKKRERCERKRGFSPPFVMILSLSLLFLLWIGRKCGERILTYHSLEKSSWNFSSHLLNDMMPLYSILRISS